MKLCLVYTLTLFTTCASKAVQLPKVDRHQSPLDGPEGSGDAVEPTFWAYGSEYAAEPPSCKSVCVTKVLEVLTVYFRSGSFKKNMHRACRAYDDAVTCMLHHRHCGTETMFESLTSGLRYMCKDQEDAFNALADCIDENSGRVRQDCDLQCHPNSLATGIALKDTVMNQLEHPLVSKRVNMRRIIEPHMSRFFFSQGCKIAQCLMGCTRSKYNMLCEGTAGSLLLEMLTLPLSTNDANSILFPSTSHLASFLGGLLPHQCSFLTAREGKRGSFRIDPALDNEIKRMYLEKKRTNLTALPNPLSQPVEVKNPFLEMSNAFHRASPFDNPESDGEFQGSGVFAQSYDQFEGSSGNVDDSLHGNVVGNETEMVSTVASSAEPTEKDIYFSIDDQAQLSPEHRVEAGSRYTIHLPKEVNTDDSFQAIQVESSSASFEKEPSRAPEGSGEFESSEIHP
ncbi:hypothetical protein V3C99_015555 [Haemonchus contortus]